jgi:hypothetical protein
MGARNVISKGIVTLGVMSSLVVLADSVFDQQRFSKSFMNTEDVVLVGKFDESYNRDVASFAPGRPTLHYIGHDRANDINGNWEITRVLDEKGEVAYDKLQRYDDSKSKIEVGFELIDVSKVRIDKDNQQVYRVSLMTEAGTIALFKEYNGGYEILEARKIVKAPALAKLPPPPLERAPIESMQMPQTKGMIKTEHTDFILVDAMDPIKGNELLRDDKVSGRAVIMDGAIQEFSATMYRGTDKETSLSFTYAELEDGGVFKTEVGDEVINGIVTNNGDSGYRIRFATGPIQGALLNFSTEQEMEKLREQQQAQLEKMEELGVGNVDGEGIEEVEGSRDVGNYEIERTEEVGDLAIANTGGGFAF